MPELDDDLDWLYRRGRYADGVVRTPPGASASAQPDRASGGPVPPSAAASTASGAPAQPVAWRYDEPAVTVPPTEPALAEPGWGEEPADAWGDQEASAPAEPPAPAAWRYEAPAEPAHRPAPAARPAAPPTVHVPASALPPTRGPRAARPRRSARRRIGLLLAGLVGVLVVYLIGVPMVAWSGMAHVDATPDGDRPADQPGTLLLLAGSDSREGLTTKDTQTYGTGSEGGNVADTIMLLYMPPVGRPALISFPRDSYVEIPGHKKNKINAAYAIGGPKLLAATIERNTGLRVDGYIGIGFGGFVSIIDALGGIVQCPTYDIKDRDSHLDLKKGCQTMNGITALNYVRMRKADPLGDIGRAQRQRSMVGAVAKKAVSPASVANPATYWKLNTAGAAALKAGRDTGLPQIAPAALAFLSIGQGDGLTLVVPISNPDAHTSAGSSVLWDEARSQEMFAMIARGDTSKLDQFKK